MPSGALREFPGPDRSGDIKLCFHGSYRFHSPSINWGKEIGAKNITPQWSHRVLTRFCFRSSRMIDSAPHQGQVPSYCHSDFPVMGPPSFILAAFFLMHTLFTQIDVRAFSGRCEARGSCFFVPKRCIGECSFRSNSLSHLHHLIQIIHLRSHIMAIADPQINAVMRRINSPFPSS